MSRFTKIEIWLGRIFLIVLSVGAAFYAAEISFRKWGHRAQNGYLDQINDTTHSPRPYVMFTGDPKKGHNRLGYLGDLPVMPKPKNETRIFVFGGSTVYGHRGTPLPVLLNELFEQKISTNIKVYNFGVVSSVGRQDFVRFLLDGLGFQPDLVIFYGGANDTAFAWDVRPNYPHRFVFYESVFSLVANVEDYHLFSSLALGSQILRTAFQKQLMNTFFKKSLDENHAHGAISKEAYALRGHAFATNMEYARLIAKAFGVHFVAVLQPILALKDQPHIDELPFYHFTEEIRTGYKKIQSELVGPDVIDLSPYFSKSIEQNFSDGMHVFPNYEKLLSQELANRLTPFVLAAMKHPAPPIPLPPETEFLPNDH